MSKRVIRTVLLSCVLIFPSVTAASAQSWSPFGGRAFVAVNGGFQIGSEDASASTTFGLFNEDAIIQTTQKIDGGGLIDVSAGYRAWRKLSFAIGYAHVTGADDAMLSGELPNPFFRGRPRSFSTPLPGLRNKRQAVRLSLIWTEEITDRIEASIGAGPTFLAVEQTLPADLEFTNSAFPFDQVTIDRVITVEESESTTGFHLDFGLSYRMLQNIDAVGFWRYTHGSADFSVPVGFKMSIDAGGNQLGLGVRYRF